MKLSMTALLLAVGLAVPSPVAAEVSKKDAERARQMVADGQKAMRKERFEEALIKFRGATQLDPGLVPARYGTGKAHMALKQYPEAAEALQTCKDLVLRQGSARQKAWVEQDRARRDALRNLEQTLDQIRSGQVKGGDRALEVSTENRLRQLREADMRGVEQQTRVPSELSLLLGSAYFRLQEFPDAKSNYKEAIGTDPSSVKPTTTWRSSTC